MSTWPALGNTMWPFLFHFILCNWNLFCSYISVFPFFSDPSSINLSPLSLIAAPVCVSFCALAVCRAGQNIDLQWLPIAPAFLWQGLQQLTPLSPLGSWQDYQGMSIFLEWQYLLLWFAFSIGPLSTQWDGSLCWGGKLSGSSAGDAKHWGQTKPSV